MQAGNLDHDPYTDVISSLGNWAVLAAKGDTGSIGAAAEYAPGTTYATGDVVFCNTTCATNGSSYVSLINSNTGHDPSANPSDWQMIAKVGATGATGAVGGVQSINTGTIANNATAGTGTASIGGTAANPVLNVNFPADVQSVTTGTIANNATAGTGTASIGGTAANPVLNVNFPNDVQSVTTGTILNTAPAGGGTASIGGTATNPVLNVNFPASSSTGFT